MNDLTQATDAELIAAIRHRRYEKVLGTLGCLVAVLATTVPAGVVASRYTHDLDGLVGALAHALVFLGAWACSIPLAAVVFGPLIAMRRIRASKPIAELRRRWGQAALSDYERRAAVMLAGGGRDAAGRPPPDFVVLFQGRELPSGRHRFLRLDLWRHGVAEAELRRAHGAIVAADSNPPSALDLVRGDVPPKLASALLERLVSLDADLPPGTSARDGFPCKCAVLRRDPPDVFHAEANLSAATNDEPAAALLGLLAAVTEVLTVEP